ncbi:MAG: OmpA family protein [Proteobacteria bacterium]|nr:OmpA family protein [Pseudomonadota bacterium]
MTNSYRTSAFALLLLCSPSMTFAQGDVPSPTGAPEKDSDKPVFVGKEESDEDAGTSRTRSRDVISGTGIIFIAPQADVGYLSTTPNSANIFSKLESTASGWLVEPKIGFGLFSEKLALDVLAGVQISSLAGNILGSIKDFSNESASAEYNKFETAKPYTAKATATLLEGNARIRFQKGAMQAGLAASTVFASGSRLYSSVPDVGVNYAVLAGPQFVYEQRIKDDLFRVGASTQFSLTGNQRNAFSFRVGASYSFLLNSPFLKVTEKKVVKNRTTVQKKIVTTREQSVIEKENVKFIFDSQTINFKFNKAELSDRSQAFVSGLGQIFAAQRSDWQKLVVEGHTDSKGNDDYNKKLSQQRADNVKRVLVENGLSADDVQAIGYGEERLLKNPEQTELDYAKNRRVEINIQGIRDARILQRSIRRLENELFSTPKSQRSPSESDQGAQQ